MLPFHFSRSTSCSPRQKRQLRDGPIIQLQSQDRFSTKSQPCGSSYLTHIYSLPSVRISPACEDPHKICRPDKEAGSRLLQQLIYLEVVLDCDNPIIHFTVCEP